LAVSVRIGEPYHVVYYAPLHVAKQGGFFEAHGLDAEIVPSASFSSLVRDGESRQTAVDSSDLQIDVGVGGIMRSLVAFDRGEAMVPVHFARVNDRDGFILLGRHQAFDWPDLLDHETIVFAEAPTPLQVMRSFLFGKGLNADRMRIIDSVPISNVAEAFQSGTGDFVLTQAHVAADLTRSGSAHVLKSMAAEAGPLPYSSYFCAPEYLQANQEKVFAVARANADALRWIQSHPADAVWDLIRPAFTGQDEAILREATARYKALGVWDSDSTISELSYDGLGGALQRGGLISRIAPYDLVIRDEPAREAERRLAAGSSRLPG
jgi:NitT/TauT family transport system substrate-binding protein